MESNRIKFILPLISIFSALYGVFHYLKSVEDNFCDMTYMFEYPEYLKISLNYNTSVKFPHYNLFIYAEGKYTEDISAHRFEGIPALFIPGNAGSHRQVRSLASVALRMSQSRQTRLHFNFFSIDFNEEISALYGGVLDEQMEFVAECIKHIQTLYSSKKKLVLIGHSMGGVIAKGVFSLSNFDSSDISLILTLASPHRKPVIAIDADIVSLYKKIKHSWRFRKKAELRNMPIISIGGGQRDVLVRSDLTPNDFEHSSNLDIHALTTSIPGVWLSVDHLAIVWCKQLVLTICRSLFDMGSLLNNEIAIKTDVLENILKFHFIAKHSGNSWSSWLPPVHSFPTSGQWIVQDDKTWRFSRAKILSSIYLMIPLSQGGRVLIVASGLNKGDWIYGCTQHSKTHSKSCVEGESLSNHGEIVPFRKSNIERRIVNLKVQDLRQKGYLSILIYIAPVTSQVEILGEVYSEVDRAKHYNLSPFERIFSFAPHRIFTISLVEQIVYYNVTFSKSVGIFQAVEFQLETRLCRAGSVVGQGLIKMHNSWSGEVSYYHIRTSLGGITHIPVILQSLPPAHIDPVINLEFFFDPECSFVLSAKFPFYLVASQFMKFYGTYTLGYSVSFLLILLSDQMNSVGSQGMPSTVYGMFGTISSFVILVIVPSVLYHLMWISNITLSFLPKPDKINESYQFFSTLLLRAVLYFISSGVILCVYFCMEIVLKVISTCTMWWKHKNILETTQMPLEQILKDRLQISKSVLVWSSVIAAVCLGMSSSLACIIASVYYFFKLASMYTRCRMEEDRRGSSAATCKWRFHILLVLLWFFVFVVTYPGLVMWLKTIKFSLKLSKDVYIFPCAIMVVSAAVFWQLPSPFIHSYKYKVVALLIKIIALMTTFYGISSIYRLLYYITTVFCIICIQQTCGYFKEFTYIKYD